LEVGKDTQVERCMHREMNVCAQVRPNQDQNQPTVGTEWWSIPQNNRQDTNLWSSHLRVARRLKNNIPTISSSHGKMEVWPSCMDYHHM